MASGVIRRQSGDRFDNLFFSGVAVVILVSVFVGFAHSYYLAGMLKAPLPNLLVHIHGAVFSCWILLLIVQTSLVAAGRVDVHRRLGMLLAWHVWCSSRACWWPPIRWPGTLPPAMRE